MLPISCMNDRTSKVKYFFWISWMRYTTTWLEDGAASAAARFTARTCPQAMDWVTATACDGICDYSKQYRWAVSDGAWQRAGVGKRKGQEGEKRQRFAGVSSCVGAGGQCAAPVVGSQSSCTGWRCGAGAVVQEVGVRGNWRGSYAVGNMEVVIFVMLLVMVCITHVTSSTSRSQCSSKIQQQHDMCSPAPPSSSQAPPSPLDMADCTGAFMTLAVSKYKKSTKTVWAPFTVEQLLHSCT